MIPAANNFSGIGGTYPSGQAAGNPIPMYVANPSLPTTWREELIRVDHNLTDSQRLTFRYIHDTWNTVNQGPLWGQYNNTFDNTNTNFAGPTTSFVARLTSNFSPSLLNEFVASYTDDHIFLSNVSNNVNLPSGGIDLNPLFANGLGNKIPAFSIGNAPACPSNGSPSCDPNGGPIYGSGGFNVDTGYFPWKNANPTYTYRDNVTKIIGVHTLTFGAYFAAAQKNQSSSVDVQGQLSFAFTNPNTSNNPFADVLLGNIAGYTQNQAELYYYDRYKILEPISRMIGESQKNSLSISASAGASTAAGRKRTTRSLVSPPTPTMPVRLPHSTISTTPSIRSFSISGRDNPCTTASFSAGNLTPPFRASLRAPRAVSRTNG